MANVPDIDLNDYNFDLPKELIAEFPPEHRGESRLLVANPNSGSISSGMFVDVLQHIPDNSLLALNNTKVISARILMLKPTGGAAEILCVSPVAPSIDPQITMTARGKCVWECIIGGRNINEGLVLESKIKSDICSKFKATILKRYENKAHVEFSWEPEELTFAAILHEIGKIPLPPYIKRDTEALDEDRYQTVFAKVSGSVAAPTAGLHFTDEIMQSLKDKKVTVDELVLHVGPGTFMPIEIDVKSHNMHSERIFVHQNSLELLVAETSKPNGGFVTATGTTTLRTLESIYWTGVKILRSELDLQETNDVLINQHEPYEYFAIGNLPTRSQAFQAIIDEMKRKDIEQFSGMTKLFIMPGYNVQTADALITNFHLPKSTLLLLVAAFVGDEFRKFIYDYAIENKFRMLSYGDSSILFKSK